MILFTDDHKAKNFETLLNDSINYFLIFKKSLTPLEIYIF